MFESHLTEIAFVPSPDSNVTFYHLYFILSHSSISPPDLVPSGLSLLSGVQTQSYRTFGQAMRYSPKDGFLDGDVLNFVAIVIPLLAGCVGRGWPGLIINLSLLSCLENGSATTEDLLCPFCGVTGKVARCPARLISLTDHNSLFHRGIVPFFVV